MARIEKTVFISYRRTDVYMALAVYQDLIGKGYDVFFDYTSISSGDFEQIILSNIRARAHFVLILTPTALDRCNEPGDWLRREIETAIDEGRNIIPLFFKGFKFGPSVVTEKLTGKLENLSRYNGLNVHEDYFRAAMDRLSEQFLDIPLNMVLHPVSTEVRKVVKEEQIAVNQALLQKKEDIDELVKPSRRNWLNLRLYGIGASILLIAILGAAGINSYIKNRGASETAMPTPSTLNNGNTMVSSEDGMTLLHVPIGEFLMGSDTGGDDARPAHTIHLESFWIDQTEVTNTMFADFLNVEGNQVGGGGPWLDATDENVRIHLNGDMWFVDSGFDRHPVVEVSWFGAQAYCSWAGRRLPTEAEWEKAASWNDVMKAKYIYPWGNEFMCTNGNFDDETQINSYVVSGGENCDGFKRTSPVGSFPAGASPYGLLDMAGNVWEWVADWYDSDYYTYSGISNPPGPESSTYRVIRGGSWLVNDIEIRAAYRYSYDPLLPSGNIGFRCAYSE